MGRCEEKCAFPKWCLVDGEPPYAQPVSTNLVKQQAAIDPSDTTYDPLIDVYIKSATELVQNWIGKTLIATSYIASWSWCFPDCLQIQNNPNFSLTKIDYIDINTGEFVTLDSDTYLVDAGKHFIDIYTVSGWPQVPDVPDVARAYYTAGFGASEADVPADIQLALAMIVTKALGERGDCGTVKLLDSAMNLLRNYKPYKVQNVTV